MADPATEEVNSPLGEDILDLSAFDGDWKQVLGAVVSQEDVETLSGLVDASPANVAPPAPLLPPHLHHAPAQAQQLIAQLLGFGTTRGAAADVRDRLFRFPRHVCAAAIRLGGNRGLVLLDAAFPMTSVTAQGLLHSPYTNHSTAAEALSLDDLISLGTEFGWTEADLVEALSPKCFIGWSENPQPGLQAFVERHDQRVSEIYEVASLKDVRRPASIHALPDFLLNRLARQIAEQATASKKADRQAVAHVQSRVGSDVIIPELKTLMLTGNASTRKHAATLLIERTTPHQRAELAEWFAENLVNETSASVREIIDIAGEVVVEPTFEPIEIEPAQVPMRALGARYQQQDKRGSDLVSVSGYVLVSQLSQLDRYIDAGQLGRALLTLNPSYSGIYLDVGNPADYLAKKGITPTFLARVAKSDSKPLTDAVITAAVLKDHARWSDSDLGDFVELLSHEFKTILEWRAGHQNTAVRAVIALLRRVSTFTELPTILLNSLAQIAMNGKKAHQAEMALWDPAIFAPVAIRQLSDDKPAKRKVAATWLGSQHHEPALEPLLAAVEVEKNAPARTAMLAALESLGHSTSELNDRDTITAQAIAAMKKKSSRSASISWLDMDVLPALSWEDGTPVEPAVIELLCHSAAKAKDPGASDMPRAQLAEMQSEGVQALGVNIFRQWLAIDLARRTDDEAVAEAAERFAYATQLHQQNPNGHYLHYMYKTDDLKIIEGIVLSEARSEIIGSGRTSIGIFAVAAACGGTDLIAEALAYLKSHRRKRKAQSKAVIDMLAAIDDPVAVQSVMAMANSYNPKALQKHASEAVARLVARKGWTHEELADRSAPDGGFDRSGRRVFDLGTRSFTALLNDDLSVSLVDDESGKSAKSLPRGRADEDAELIKELRADFKTAKKDLEAAAGYQPIRLRRAMATQRTWTLPDFTTFILDHPVMIRLATQLIWTADHGEGQAVFRPLTDGTLLDLDDEELTLDESSSIRIAHTRTVDQETELAAIEHLADYEVPQLFAQFGRTAAPEGPITTFDGKVVTATAFASRARQLGWQVSETFGTGAAIGVVNTFEDLKLAAVLTVQHGLVLGGYDMSGDETCTVSQLIVTGLPVVQRPKRISLDEVPSTLLDEVFADATTIAS